MSSVGYRGRSAHHRRTWQHCRKSALDQRYSWSGETKESCPTFGVMRQIAHSGRYLGRVVNPDGGVRVEMGERWSTEHV
jgi:hypothetical protein